MSETDAMLLGNLGQRETNTGYKVLQIEIILDKNRMLRCLWTLIVGANIMIFTFSYSNNQTFPSKYC